MFEHLLKKAEILGNILFSKRLWITTAESCTGGQLAYLLTSIAGSSNWFERGYVTYSNLAKQENLSVPQKMIETYGAVSEETALAMAEGALIHATADISLVTTGIAGPGGGSLQKPVGTVWIAYCFRNQKPMAQCFLFEGNRLAVRDKTCDKAFELILENL